MQTEDERRLNISDLNQLFMSFSKFQYVNCCFLQCVARTEGEVKEAARNKGIKEGKKSGSECYKTL